KVVQQNENFLQLVRVRRGDEHRYRACAGLGTFAAPRSAFFAAPALGSPPPALGGRLRRFHNPFRHLFNFYFYFGLFTFSLRLSGVQFPVSGYARPPASEAR